MKVLETRKIIFIKSLSQLSCGVGSSQGNKNKVEKKKKRFTNEEQVKIIKSPGDIFKKGHKIKLKNQVRIGGVRRGFICFCLSTMKI